MQIQPYPLDELQFAYCYRVYLRWRTYRARPQPLLANLDQVQVDELARPFGIHVLECSASQTDILLLASLTPTETVSACASMLKGRISKWLKESLGLPEPTELLAKGYFACTTGKSGSTEVAEYLDRQAEHHGYDSRPRPPVWVRTYELSTDEEATLCPHHARALLQYHLVLATLRRRGIFRDASAEAVASAWRLALGGMHAVLLKVSFLPDHVHVALRAHPAVAPADLAVGLMNLAQEVVWRGFPDDAIRARVERLWQPSAYVGSYGDLESPKIRQYIRNWEADESA